MGYITVNLRLCSVLPSGNKALMFPVRKKFAVHAFIKNNSVSNTFSVIEVKRAACCLLSSVQNFPTAIPHQKFMDINLQDASYNTSVFNNDDIEILCIKLFILIVIT